MNLSQKITLSISTAIFLLFLGFTVEMEQRITRKIPQYYWYGIIIGEDESVGVLARLVTKAKPSYLIAVFVLGSFSVLMLKDKNPPSSGP